MKEFLNHFVQFVQSYGIAGLTALAFAESSFFPIPPDVLLLPMAFMNRKLALLYALITTLSSVFGGIFGHFLGKRLGRPLLKKFFKEESIKKVEEYFDRYGGWAVGIAGFTPIPYKLFTISAGVFGVEMPVFILSSVIGRGARFFLEGFIIFFFGDIAKYYLTNYFELITIILTLLCIAAYLVWKRLKDKKKVAGTGAAAWFKKKYNKLYKWLVRYKKYDEAVFFIITGISLSLISLFLFLELIEDYFERGSWGFDERIFAYIHSIRNEGLTYFFKFFTNLGYFPQMFILTLLVCIYLFYTKKNKLSIYFAANILGVWMFNEALKILFKRQRPSGIGIIEAYGYSFPSGHAMIFMAFSLLLIYFILLYSRNNKISYFFCLFIFLIALFVGLSRVYLGVHYFSDVLAGWFAGILWTSSSIVIHRIFTYRSNSIKKV